MDWDKKLRIQTAGLDDSSADVHHNRYEPTEYTVLERLAESGYVNRKNTVIDYGCGKGRVGFFLNHTLGCRTVGVEYDPEIFRQALANQMTYPGKDGVEFVCSRAEEYAVQEGDCFYFFNPFSVEILAAVLGRLLESWYENPRPMKLFFYYPDDRYRAWLLTMEQLRLMDEIDCRDLFPGNDPREQILIFTLEP